MLFTDGPISTVDQLADYESDIRQLATDESINLDSKLRLAQTEMGVELLATTVQPDAGYGLPGYNLAGYNVAFARNSFTLDRVVVTDALRLWHIFATLATVYRDAYNRKLNDKYLPKWNEYRDLARGAQDQCMTIGVGLVYKPIPGKIGRA